MTLRLGVIGYGGRIHGVIEDCIRRLDPGARVVAVTDLDPAKARARLGAAAEGVRFHAEADEMLDRGGLDGVLIGTRCDQHTPMAMKVMRRNLPMYLEKPVATSRAQALELHAAAKGYAAPCVVSFPMRLTPMVLKARELVADGAIGRLAHIQAVNNVNYGRVYFDEWYRDFGVTQGLFLQKATHDLDYLSFIAGERPRQVAAMMSRGKVYGGDRPAGLRCSACDRQEECPESPAWARRFGNTQPAWRTEGDHACCFGVDIGDDARGCNEDSSSCLVEFESGLQAVYSQNFFVRRQAGARGANIIGNAGTIQFDWNTNRFRLVRHYRAETVDFTLGSDIGGHGGGDIELANDFLRAMRHGEPGRSPLAAGIQSAIVCLACRESAESRRFVEVSYPER